MTLSRRFVFSVVLVSAAAMTASAPAQQPPQFGGFGGGGALGLLQREDIRKELDIVEDQVTKIQELARKQQETMRDAFSGLRNASGEERREFFASIQERLREQQEKINKDLDDILLPHQKQRLDQIQLQTQLRRRGTTGALSSEGIIEALGITEEQIEKLGSLRQEVEKEMQEKMAQIRAEAEEKLLGILTPAQRAKWKTMVGERFELPQPNFRFGGRQGGQGRPGGGDGNPPRRRRPNGDGN